MFNKKAKNCNELLLFPQKVLFYKCEKFEEIRKNLIDYCYGEKKKNKSANLTLINGWQSNSNIHENKDFFIFLNYLNDNIENCIKDYHIKPQGFYVDTCVINIGSQNSYQNSHTHPHTHMSGVFWIQIPPNSGEFVFENPSNFAQSKVLNLFDENDARNNNLYQSYNINPIEGHILFFPPNLRHGVNLNKSELDRITVGFNITFV